MNNLLNRFSKEQWMFGASVLVAVLVLLFGGAPGAGETEPTPEIPRQFVSFPLIGEQAPLGKWDQYRRGKNFLAPPGKARQALPILPLPDPMLEAPALPPFSPQPDMRTLVQQFKWNELYVVKGESLIDEAELDLTGWDEIVALELEDVAARIDKRGEKVPGREFDEIIWLAGDRPTVRGEILGETVQDVRIMDEKTNTPRVIPISDRIKIVRSQTYEQLYKERREDVGAFLRKRYALARDLVGWGMIPEAMEELEFICSRQDEALEEHYFKALDDLIALYLEEAHFEKAVEILSGALERSKERNRITKIRARLGLVWEKYGQLDRALKEYEEAFPSVLDAGVYRGRTLYRKGDAAGAVQALTEVLEMPVPPKGQLAFARALRGLARIQAEMTPEGIRLIEGDIDSALSADETQAHALLGRGVLKAFKKDYKGAVIDLIASIQSDPFLGDAWTTLGLIFVAAGKLSEAETCVQKGLERAPDTAELHSVQAMVEILRGDLSAARAAFERAITVRTDNYYAHYGLGHLDLVEGRIEESKTHFLEAIRAEFYYSPLYYNAAIAHVKSGDLQTAEGLLQEALKIRPGDREFVIALTSLYLKQRKIAAADALYQQVAPRSAGDGTLLYLNAYIKYYGDDPKAERRVKRARDHLVEAAASGSAEAVRMVREVSDWLRTYVLLNDRFTRTDNDLVGAGWHDNDADVFPIGIVDGRCRFSSGNIPSEQTDLVYWSVEREIPGKDFYVVEATFIPTVISKIESFGLGLFEQTPSGSGGRGMAVRIHHDYKDQKPHVAFLPNITEAAVRNTKRAWRTSYFKDPLDPQEIRVKIELERQEDGSFLLMFFIFEGGGWRQFKKTAFNMTPHAYKLAFFVRAKMNVSYEFDVDNVLVLQRKQ